MKRFIRTTQLLFIFLFLIIFHFNIYSMKIFNTLDLTVNRFFESQLLMNNNRLDYEIDEVENESNDDSEKVEDDNNDDEGAYFDHSDQNESDFEHYDE